MLDALPLVLAQNATEAPAKAAPTKDAAAEATSTTGAPGAPVTPGTPGAPAPAKPFGMDFMLLVFVGFFVLMIFMQMRSQKKEKKQREALLSALKKGDKVQTIGGIIGTVVEVRPDRVVLKTDENNNSKTTFVRSAIQTILTEEAPKEEPQVKSQPAGN